MAEKGCDCFEKMNELLATKHYQLVGTISLSKKPPLAIIATEKRMDAPRRAPKFFLAASFCPFCGKEYPKQ